jgi:hypothetical protein
MVRSSQLLVDGSALLRRLVAWPLQAAAARRAMAQLAGLDDRELSDIGLSRQDLSSSDPSGVLRARGEDRCLRRNLLLARQEPCGGAQTPAPPLTGALAPRLEDLAYRRAGSDFRVHAN